MGQFLRLVAFIWLCAVVSTMEKTEMYMKSQKVRDQSMSETGYSYNKHDQLPKELSFETDDESKALKRFKDLVYDPFAEVPRYATEPLPLPYEHYYKDYSDVGNDKPLAFNINNHRHKFPETNIVPGLYSPLDQYEKITYPPLYPYAHGYGHHSHGIGHFLKKGGKQYGAEEASKKGQQTATGYDKIDGFDRALKGTYGVKDSDSYYDQNGGKKHSVYDNAGNYASNNAAGKTYLRGSFGQDSGHNKGSKTSGYHKRYHKDDYNKQHKFYDKADKKGFFNKYGDFNAKSGGDKGFFVNGGSANQGYDSKGYGAKGDADQGKFEDVAKGFRKGDGNEEFYQEYSRFGKNGGAERGSAQGYST